MRLVWDVLANTARPMEAEALTTLLAAHPLLCRPSSRVAPSGEGRAEISGGNKEANFGDVAELCPSAWKADRLTSVDGCPSSLNGFDFTRWVQLEVSRGSSRWTSVELHRDVTGAFSAAPFWSPDEQWIAWKVNDQVELGPGKVLIDLVDGAKAGDAALSAAEAVLTKAGHPVAHRGKAGVPHATTEVYCRSVWFQPECEAIATQLHAGYQGTLDWESSTPSSWCWAPKRALRRPSTPRPGRTRPLA